MKDGENESLLTIKNLIYLYKRRKAENENKTFLRRRQWVYKGY